MADSLSLSWRRQLTAVAHKRYLKRNNFYTVSQLAGMQVRANFRVWQVFYVIHVVVAFAEWLWFLELKDPKASHQYRCTVCLMWPSLTSKNAPCVMCLCACTGCGPEADAGCRAPVR